jgi:hypothetical protein
VRCFNAWISSDEKIAEAAENNEKGIKTYGIGHV